MSDAKEPLMDAAGALFNDLCTPIDVRRAEQEEWSPTLWAALHQAGFPLVGVSEEAGGSGGDLIDACALLEVAGRFAAPVPLAESGVVGGWLLASAGLALPDGPVTTAPLTGDDVAQLERGPQSWRLRCRVTRVPWAAHSGVVALLAAGPEGPAVVALPRASFSVEPGRNLAGEPRPTVSADVTLGDDAVAPAPPAVDAAALWLRGALARAALMAGAMQRVSELTLHYSQERQQFGRPIARFQAVQRHLVRLAEQAQAAKTATEAAALNGVTRGLDLFDVASAKIVAGDAATVVTATSHQAHGAMGMTREYELAQLTRRLWSWRDEWGSEAHWSRLLGHHVAEQGADALWPRIATGLVA